MIKFGTGGWRDYIGEGFNRDNIEKIAQAIANLNPKTPIAIGYDHRFLSDKAAGWLATVLASNGIKVILASDASPTPFVMLYVKNKHLDYGLMVTASHNPYDFNGIKIFTKGGIDSSLEFTNKLEEKLKGKLKINNSELSQTQTNKLITKLSFNDYYHNHLPAMIDLPIIIKSKIKLIVDPMHGVGKKGLAPIFHNSNFKIDYINANQDYLFGGKVPAPNKNNLNDLKDKVLKGKYDLGVALDGDADRIGIIDDLGNYLDANRLLTLLYYYFLKYENKRGNAVRSLCTTNILDKIAKDYKQLVIETKVGYKYISFAMNKYNGLIGGEASGGISMLGHIDGKDSIFATLLILMVLAKSKKKISTLMTEVESSYGKTHINELSYHLSETKKQAMNKMLMIDKKIPNLPYKIINIQYIDGLKINLENDYWISLRFSGTEPLLRLIYEVSDKKMGNKIIASFEKFYKI